MGLTKSNIKVEGKTKEEIVKDREQKPELEICTSWDDGAELDLRIAILLKKYNLPGVFYIVVDNVGKPDYLSWDQIKDLEHQGFEIGSHTMSHPSDLKALYDEKLHYEVQTSKDILESVLGHSVAKFAYPRGRYDRRVQEFVIKAGYVEARGTGVPGIVEVKDKYAIPGTIHIFDRAEYTEKSIIQFAKDTIDRGRENGGYINIWGHSWEIERYKLWKVLEEILDYASKK